MMVISEKQIHKLVLVLANSIRDLTDLQKMGMATSEHSKNNLKGMRELHSEIINQQSEKLREIE